MSLLLVIGFYLVEKNLSTIISSNILNNNFDISLNEINLNFNGEISIEDFVNFVAIKNGEHQSKGFAYFSNGLRDISPDSNSHVSNIHNTVLEYFKIYDF